MTMAMVKMADLFFHFASAKAAAVAVLAAYRDAGTGPLSWQECHLQCLHTWEPCPSTDSHTINTHQTI